MLVGNVPEVGASEDQRQLVMRAKIIETKIKSLAKTVRKECQVLRAQKRDLYVTNPKDREGVLAFLSDEKLFEVIGAYMYLAKESMTDHEQLLT